MTTQDWKELAAIVKWETEQENKAAALKAYEREQYFKSGMEFSISLVYSELHPAYGKSRELQYQSFTIEGFQNAHKIYKSYIESGFKLKLEKISISLLKSDGSKERYHKTTFQYK